MRALVFLLWSLCLHAAIAQTPWPPELTQYYLRHCTSGLRDRGAGPTRADQVCQCMASGLSESFGIEGFDAMRMAQRNPTGSAIDQRFHAVAQRCAPSPRGF